MTDSKKTQHDFYNEVYSQDNPSTNPHGWIQWKGTDVCMDLYCSCGHHGHVDCDFFYYYECPKCKEIFAVGQNVRLIPLNEEQKEHAKEYGCEPRTCELDKDE